MSPLATSVQKHPPRALLLSGVISGPIFFTAFLLQALTRAGFDLRVHPLSLLDLGNLGWIQRANFTLTGLLAIGGSLGLRRAMAGVKGGTWAPRLVTIYGIGLILAGIFRPDPGYGFPPGAPAGPTVPMSTHMAIHDVGFVLVVLPLTAACFVAARWFGVQGDRLWRAYSMATGVLCPVLLIASVATTHILGLTIMSFFLFNWASLVCLRLSRRYLRTPSSHERPDDQEEPVWLEDGEEQ